MSSKTKEKTGHITSVGTQVTKESSLMYIELDGVRIDLPKDKKITVKVEG